MLLNANILLLFSKICTELGQCLRKSLSGQAFDRGDQPVVGVGDSSLLAKAFIHLSGFCCFFVWARGPPRLDENSSLGLG